MTELLTQQAFKFVDVYLDGVLHVCVRFGCVFGAEAAQLYKRGENVIVRKVGGHDFERLYAGYPSRSQEMKNLGFITGARPGEE